MYQCTHSTCMYTSFSYVYHVGTLLSCTHALCTYALHTSLLLCTHAHALCLLTLCVFYLYTITHQCLVFLGSVGAPRDGSAVLLAHPAQVTHGLHHYHMREELPPQRSEGRVAHWTHGLSTRSLLVELPHLMFRGACWGGAECPSFCTREHGQEGPLHSPLICVHVRSTNVY